MRLTLGQRIGWSSTALTLAVAGALGVTAYLDARRLVGRETAAVLEAAAAVGAQRAEVALAQLAREVASLARSPLFANALLDSAGREAYLVPFVRDLDLSGTLAVRVSLHDFRGRPLAWGRLDGGGADLSAEPWVREVVAGRALATVSRGTAGTRLVLAHPVVLPGTGEAEGMVVAVADLSSALRDLQPAGELAPTVSLKAGDGTVLASAGHGHPDAATPYAASRAVEPGHPFAGLGLHAVASESRAHAERPLDDLVLRFALVGVALAGLTAVLGQRLGRGLARRVVALEAATRRVALEEGEPAARGPARGDEVDALAAGLERMAARVRRSQAEMEARVEDRTAELAATAADLAASRDRLDLVIAGTGVGIWDWNPQTGSVAVNRRWAEIVGYTLEELRPISIQTWASLAHADDLRLSGEALEEVFAGRVAVYECDARMRHKDGRWVWVRDTGRVIERDAEGRPTRMVGTHLDITAEKAVLEQATAHRAQLEAILAAAPDGIMTVDADLRVTRFNPAAEALFGWRSEEVRGRPLSLLLPEAMRGRHDALARGFFQDGPAVRRQMAGWRTVMARRRDGTEFPALVTLSGTTLDGRPAVVAALKDVTVIEAQKGELGSLAARLGEQLRLAQEANRAKTRFLAALSHELRTPLNAIIGFSEMVALDDAGRIGPAKRQEYAADVSRAGHHLLSLIDDLLDLARIEERRLDLRPEPCDVADLAAEPLRMLAPGMAERGLSVASDVPGGLPPVLADRRAVRQVLVNLLGNAAKFTPAGGSVTLSARAHGPHQVSLAVADTGRGIPAARIPHLARPFEQVDQHWEGNASGLGLGLAISRQLAEQMGGSLVIESRLGAWTRVTLTLPVAPGLGTPAVDGDTPVTATPSAEGSSRSPSGDGPLGSTRNTDKAEGMPGAPEGPVPH